MLYTCPSATPEAATLAFIFKISPYNIQQNHRHDFICFPTLPQNLMILSGFVQTEYGTHFSFFFYMLIIEQESKLRFVNFAR